MKIKFEPRDMWVGLYWDRKPWQYKPGTRNTGDGTYVVTTYYLCIVPCFPIIWKRARPMKAHD